MAKTIKVDEFGYIELSSLKEYVDINKVEFYKMKVKKDKSIHIKFYDGKKKLVKPYGRK